jgi:hypothetical protein
VLEELQDREGNLMREVPGGGWHARVRLPGSKSKMGLFIKDLTVPALSGK